jgi:hypothetical protein
MDKNTFQTLGLTLDDVVVCTGVSIGAPKGIIGKAFILKPGYMSMEPCLPIDGDEAHYYTGGQAKWRRATVSDVARKVATLRTTLPGMEPDVLAVETGESVADLLRSGMTLTPRAISIPDDIDEPTA